LTKAERAPAHRGQAATHQSRSLREERTMMSHVIGVAGASAAAIEWS
jgi:hypothetical protein